MYFPAGKKKTERRKKSASAITAPISNVKPTDGDDKKLETLFVCLKPYLLY